MANNEDDETAVRVYQCAKCLTILGDSLLEKASNEELGIVGLTKVSPDVTVKADSNLEHQGIDEGCIYRVLRCKCEQPIGRIYVKTSRKLQNLVNLYCIKQNQIVIYRVGMAEVVNVQEREKDDSIRQSFAKIEKMIMIFHARLKSLEDSFEVQTTEDVDETRPMGNKKTDSSSKSRKRRQGKLESSSPSS